MEVQPEILLCSCKSLEEAQWVRGELISFNPRDYWFYVLNDFTIKVANDFGGRISQEKFDKAKEKADQLIKEFRSKAKS